MTLGDEALAAAYAYMCTRPGGLIEFVLARHLSSAVALA